jgi:ADP-dependent NAD(P)H-hydrate dehydratase / NAD(P)H-hydrate epimerase
MYLLNRQEMYDCDKYTIENLGIASAELMERAGRGSAEYIRDHILGAEGSILLFCGSGNNGGDGFVIASYLQDWGFSVKIVLTGNLEKMSAETSENYQRCRKKAIEIYKPADYEGYKDLQIDITSYDLVIDAIFGIGFKGNLRGWLPDLISEINELSTKTVAIDIASGLDADNGRAGSAIIAQYTLTMAAIKYGMVLGAGKTFSGKIIVIDIGIPQEVIRQKSLPATLATEDSIVLPQRQLHYHKGNYGRIAIIAGSPGFSGAAVLASTAALRSGAGLITLFHPKGMETIFEIKLLEVMTRPLPDDTSELINLLAPYDVVLFGPGTGTSHEMLIVLKSLVSDWKKPMVIDADGINLISLYPELLQSLADRNVLLTPHIGEFSRLSGYNIREILDDPIRILSDFCRSHHLLIMLKSSSSIICDRKNTVITNAGNDGLATGGSGDVLSGIITGFCGQKMSLLQAGISANLMIGKTCELLSSWRNKISIIPSDIVDNFLVTQKH